jgi:hypothetical protein
MMALLSNAPASAEQEQAEPDDSRIWEGQEYSLRRLRITGNGQSGELEFELEGALIADGWVEVPLFGPPDRVELDDVTYRGGRPALVSFNTAGYFLATDSPSFVVRGRITLTGGRELEIGGPLNLLEADLSEGRVDEGSRLTGLVDETIHFVGDPEPSRDSLTRDQLVMDRAVRVGPTVEFTYLLTAPSDGFTGVLRIPLRNGEQVAYVDGSVWREEGTDLVLTPYGRFDTITIHGSLPEADRYEFSNGSRADQEEWLIESDLRHDLTIEGGRQVDPGGSIFHRVLAQGWQYMLEPGQTLQVAVRRLFPGQVPVAVVRTHSQTATLTAQGDVIAEDTLEYEATSSDRLVLDPQGRAFFVGTDEETLPLVHARRGARELILPLWPGVHRAKVQSVSRHEIGWLGGAFEVPVVGSELTEVEAVSTVGLPASVYPVALAGSDRGWYAVEGRDGLAVLLALAAAWFVLRTRRRRALGGVVLGGLWFLSPALYVGALAALALGGLLWVLHAVLAGRARATRWIATGVLAAAVAAVGLGLATGWPHALRLSFDILDAGADRFAANDLSRIDCLCGDEGPPRLEALGNGVLRDEMETLALPMPRSDRTLEASRHLVTPERPFRPVVYYVTWLALAPLLLAWLACVLALAWSGRHDLAALRCRLESWAGRGGDQPSPDEPGMPAGTG